MDILIAVSTGFGCFIFCWALAPRLAAWYLREHLAGLVTAAVKDYRETYCWLCGDRIGGQSYLQHMEMHHSRSLPASMWGRIEELETRLINVESTAVNKAYVQQVHDKLVEVGKRLMELEKRPGGTRKR